MRLKKLDVKHRKAVPSPPLEHKGADQRDMRLLCSSLTSQGRGERVDLELRDKSLVSTQEFGTAFTEVLGKRITSQDF